MTKYCRDCAAFVPFLVLEARGCGDKSPMPVNHEKSLCAKGPLNVVSGELDSRESNCREMRYRGACGPEGKLFEAKNEAV